jgi:RNA polymerase sigma-70 factor (ECF subfamily)
MSFLDGDHTAGTRAVAVGDADERELREALDVYLSVRKRLFRIAYRTLGSVSEAEDVTQEAWMRWQRTDRAAVVDPAAFLATTTSRLALNVAMSARARHENVTDPRLFDPVRSADDPASRSERDHDVERGITILLQTLTPRELAAYLLRKPFDYPYQRIAEMLRIRPDHVRQLVSRAQHGIRTRQRRPVQAEVIRRHVNAFRLASWSGDFEALEQVLCVDAREPVAA